MNDDRPPSPEGSSDTWLRRVGRTLAGAPRNREEITALLQEAAQLQVIDSDALEMMEGVLDTADTPVEDIMVPRSQMVVVELDDEPQEILRTVVESGHSRFPVIGENSVSARQLEGRSKQVTLPNTQVKDMTISPIFSIFFFKKGTVR